MQEVLTINRTRRAFTLIELLVVIAIIAILAAILFPVFAATCGRYATRISGPLLDRIDLHIHVPRLKPEELLSMQEGEPSGPIRERVCRARARQAARFGRSKVNARMTPREIREMIGLSDECRAFMKTIAAKLNLSARVFDRVLKVSRTIADLAGCDHVEKPHLAEAVQYRERTEL